MEKSTAHTIVTIATIGSFCAAGAWAILSEIADSRKANAEAIAELRAEMKAENAEIRAEIAEIRGLVFSHVVGHQHGVSDAGGNAGDGDEQTPPSN